MKVFALRFDIDTPKCLVAGVPPLLRLAERLDARFTFFLNVGRSVSVPGFINRKLNGYAYAESAASFSAARKLGRAQYLYTALVNPRIGRLAADVVRRLAATQDLGLHGGRNHDTWHFGAGSWPRERVRHEVEWALNELRRLGVENLKGFSAPGWSDSPHLPQTLRALGFDYRADRHGTDQTWGEVEAGGLINVGTNLTGEPGGVAYVEHHRALGKTTNQILAEFEERLERAGDYAVMYDHPYFAGVHEIELLESMLNLVRRRGFRITTLREISDLSRRRLTA